MREKVIIMKLSPVPQSRSRAWRGLALGSGLVGRSGCNSFDIRRSEHCLMTARGGRTLASKYVLYALRNISDRTIFHLNKLALIQELPAQGCSVRPIYTLTWPTLAHFAVVFCIRGPILTIAMGRADCIAVCRGREESVRVWLLRTLRSRRVINFEAGDGMGDKQVEPGI